MEALLRAHQDEASVDEFGMGREIGNPIQVIGGEPLHGRTVPLRRKRLGRSHPAHGPRVVKAERWVRAEPAPNN